MRAFDRIDGKFKYGKFSSKKCEEIIDIYRENPYYWKEHLDEKIARIKLLQDEGEKEYFSYIVLTDIHYETNLVKLSPLLVKKIADECGINYIITLGDKQNRSAQNFTKEKALDEWDVIKIMCAPIAAKELPTQGNHDGSFVGKIRLI